MTAPQTPTAQRDTSTIHDLGYRRYDGPRVGTRGAWSALYTQSLRAMFGIGRTAKAKVIPVFVVVVTVLPALATLVAASASNGQAPIRYGQIIGAQLLLFVLFLAAQVPEVLSRDQQHKLLPLLFTRDVTRVAYATSRCTAIFSAIFVVALAPLLLLFVGEFGLSKDPSGAFATIGPRIGPVLLQATLTAWSMGGIGAALSVWTPRRAYATASIFAAFLLLVAIATGLDDLAGVSVRVAELLDPLRALRTMALMLFGETNRGMELNPPPSLGVYIALMTSIGVAGFGIVLLRMRRIRA